MLSSRTERFLIRTTSMGKLFPVIEVLIEGEHGLTDEELEALVHRGTVREILAEER